MIYPIYIIGNEVLRKEGKELPLEKTEELNKLLADMFETMKVSDGVGLAAPQIGKSLKLFVIDASPLADEEPELADYKHAFINAKILEKTGKRIRMNEGCLSIPGLHEDVIRYDTIHIQYYDENLQYHDEEISGYLSRIIQHEYDHTYGILFTDRIANIKKTLLKNKLKNMALGKFKASYKTVLGNRKTVEQFIFRKIDE